MRLAARRKLLAAGLLCLVLASHSAQAQTAAQAIDIPTRPGVTQRFIYIAPPHPKAAVILLAGGQGNVQIAPDGSTRNGNFLVRSRQLFVDAGLAVAVVDAPSDKQSPPYLGGNRQTPEHTADLLAVMTWLRRQSPVQVWLIGTSRGTQSAAYVATQLSRAAGGPDGLVLTSTILTDTGRAVPRMPVDELKIPVLVVHHTQDGCKACAPAELPQLMDKLAKTPAPELITVSGGISQGDPCEARAYHGFNGMEADVVGKISNWVANHLR